mgnify:CR=1 FL=1
MAKLQKKLGKTDLILIIIILILIVINLTLYTKKILQPKQDEQKTYQLTTVVRDKEENTKKITVPETDEEIIKKLSTLEERDRMEYYCGVYFKHIEKKEYEQAYNLLYTEFKKNYFPTIEDFEEYVQKTYPSTWALEYSDITRQGTIYVLKLKILDLYGSKENEKSQRIVVQENNYNDFVISFQVI